MFNMRAPLCLRPWKSGRTNLLEPRAQLGFVDAVDERPLAVDLDDRQPLPVTALELGDAGDVHDFEVERSLGPDTRQGIAHGLAKRAVSGNVELHRLHAASVVRGRRLRPQALALTSQTDIGCLFPVEIAVMLASALRKPGP